MNTEQALFRAIQNLHKPTLTQKLGELNALVTRFTIFNVLPTFVILASLRLAPWRYVWTTAVVPLSLILGSLVIVMFYALFVPTRTQKFAKAFDDHMKEIVQQVMAARATAAAPPSAGFSQG